MDVFAWKNIALVENKVIFDKRIADFREVVTNENKG